MKSPFNWKGTRNHMIRFFTWRNVAGLLLVLMAAMALWPSGAGAASSGSIRKFTGPLRVLNGALINVNIHNPHATSTLKATIVTRNTAGVADETGPISIPPNQTVLRHVDCIPVSANGCSVEVNMANAILQPSVAYISSITNDHELVYAGDFSR